MLLMPAKEELGDTVSATGLPERWSASLIKKRLVDKCVAMDLIEGYSLQFHNNNFNLKQLSTTAKSFITKALKYKAILKFKK